MYFLISKQFSHRTFHFEFLLVFLKHLLNSQCYSHMCQIKRPRGTSCLSKIELLQYNNYIRPAILFYMSFFNGVASESSVTSDQQSWFQVKARPLAKHELTCLTCCQKKKIFKHPADKMASEQRKLNALICYYFNFSMLQHFSCSYFEFVCVVFLSTCVIEFDTPALRFCLIFKLICI